MNSDFCYSIPGFLEQHTQEVKGEIASLYNWEEDHKYRQEKIRYEVSILMKQTRFDNLIILSAIWNHKTDIIKKNINFQCSPEAREVKYKKAKLFKNDGNNAVQEKNYETALVLYTKAIDLYKSDALFFSNRALCHLKLGK